MDYRLFFEDAESHLLNALSDESGLKRSHFEAAYHQAVAALKSDLATGTIDHDLASHILRATNNIKTISENFLLLTREADEIVCDTRRKATEIMLGCGSAPNKKSENYQVDSPHDALHSQLYRRWFIDNIADPFPSTELKHELVAKTNAIIAERSAHDDSSSEGAATAAGTSYEQCLLWFINIRRRSKWTEFFRKYAGEDKERMQGLVRALQSQESGAGEQPSEEIVKLLVTDKHGRERTGEELQKHVQACYTAWTDMMTILEQRVIEQAGDRLSNAIQRAKEEYRQMLSRKKGERRRIREHYQKQVANRSYAKTVTTPSSTDKKRRVSALPRKARKTATVSPSCAAHRPTTPVASQRASLRSASGSSADSFSSVPDSCSSFDSIAETCSTSVDSVLDMAHPAFGRHAPRAPAPPESPLQGYGWPLSLEQMQMRPTN